MENTSNWKCAVCGYVHQGTEAPGVCPICGADQSAFTAFQINIKPAPKTQLNRWRCSVCGFDHEGVEPPEHCPVCSANAQLFTPIEIESAIAQFNQVETILIVGGGIAAVTAAEQARLINNKATITIVAKESTLPYYRMNLTRYLGGEIKQDDLALKPKQWYQENKITIIYDEVKLIERDKKKIKLVQGDDLTYDRLILANGAHAFVPSFPGVAKSGVHVLRSLEDGQTILSQLKGHTKALVIGGGLLGLETAGALRKHNIDVGLLEGHGWLLPRQLTQPAGLKLKAYVEKLGIHVYGQAKTKSINGDEVAKSITLESGQEIPADLVIICAGVRCNSYLARISELRVNRGVVVDDRMFTSDPNILAAGDLTEHEGICYGIWPASHTQGLIAGTNAAGGEAFFTAMPSSTRLKVLGIDLVSIGQIEAPDASYETLEQVFEETYQYYVVRDGVLIGAILYGDISNASMLLEVIEKKSPLAENIALSNHLDAIANNKGVSLELLTGANTTN